MTVDGALLRAGAHVPEAVDDYVRAGRVPRENVPQLIEPIPAVAPDPRKVP